jgi:cytochrome b6-f complex iron-sulfur subunit
MLPVLPASDPEPTCASCNRRTLLQALGAALAATVVLPACGDSGGNNGADAHGPADSAGTCSSGELCLDVTQAPYTPLASVGGAVVVRGGSDQIMVVRTDQTTVAALSAICTHQGCTTNYVNSSKQLDCPCHGAQFSLTGTVLRGPATLPLHTYTASVAGNIITVKLR